eukprot:g6463.t1
MKTEKNGEGWIPDRKVIDIENIEHEKDIKEYTEAKNAFIANQKDSELSSSGFEVKELIHLVSKLVSANTAHVNFMISNSQANDSIFASSPYLHLPTLILRSLLRCCGNKGPSTLNIAQSSTLIGFVKVIVCEMTSLLKSVAEKNAKNQNIENVSVEAAQSAKLCIASILTLSLQSNYIDDADAALLLPHLENLASQAQELLLQETKVSILFGKKHLKYMQSAIGCVLGALLAKMFQAPTKSILKIEEEENNLLGNFVEENYQQCTINDLSKCCDDLSPPLLPNPATLIFSKNENHEGEKLFTKEIMNGGHPLEKWLRRQFRENLGVRRFGGESMKRLCRELFLLALVRLQLIPLACAHTTLLLEAKGKGQGRGNATSLAPSKPLVNAWTFAMQVKKALFLRRQVLMSKLSGDEALPSIDSIIAPVRMRINIVNCFLKKCFKPKSAMNIESEISLYQNRDAGNIIAALKRFVTDENVLPMSHILYLLRLNSARCLQRRRAIDIVRRLVEYGSRNVAEPLLCCLRAVIAPLRGQMKLKMNGMHGILADLPACESSTAAELILSWNRLLGSLVSFVKSSIADSTQLHSISLWGTFLFMDNRLPEQTGMLNVLTKKVTKADNLPIVDEKATVLLPPRPPSNLPLPQPLALKTIRLLLLQLALGKNIDYSYQVIAVVFAQLCHWASAMQSLNTNVMKSREFERKRSEMEDYCFDLLRLLYPMHTRGISTMTLRVENMNALLLLFSNGSGRVQRRVVQILLSVLGYSKKVEQKDSILQTMLQCIDLVVAHGTKNTFVARGQISNFNSNVVSNPTTKANTNIQCAVDELSTCCLRFTSCQRGQQVVIADRATLIMLMSRIGGHWEQALSLPRHVSSDKKTLEAAKCRAKDRRRLLRSGQCGRIVRLSSLSRTVEIEFEDGEHLKFIPAALYPFIDKKSDHSEISLFKNAQLRPNSKSSSICGNSNIQQGATGVWSWQTNRGVWKAYDRNSQILLESAFNENIPRTGLKIGNQTYGIDFASALQFNINTKNTRPIRRQTNRMVTTSGSQRSKTKETTVDEFKSLYMRQKDGGLSGRRASRASEASRMLRLFLQGSCGHEWKNATMNAIFKRLDLACNAVSQKFPKFQEISDVSQAKDICLLIQSVTAMHVLGGLIEPLRVGGPVQLNSLYCPSNRGTGTLVHPNDVDELYPSPRGVGVIWDDSDDNSLKSCQYIDSNEIQAEGPYVCDDVLIAAMPRIYELVTMSLPMPDVGPHRMVENESGAIIDNDAKVDEEEEEQDDEEEEEPTKHRNVSWQLLWAQLRRSALKLLSIASAKELKLSSPVVLDMKKQTYIATARDTTGTTELAKVLVSSPLLLRAIIERASTPLPPPLSNLLLPSNANAAGLELALLRARSIVLALQDSSLLPRSSDTANIKMEFVEEDEKKEQPKKGKTEKVKTAEERRKEALKEKALMLSGMLGMSQEFCELALERCGGDSNLAANFAFENVERAEALIAEKKERERKNEEAKARAIAEMEKASKIAEAAAKVGAQAVENELTTASGGLLLNKHIPTLANLLSGLRSGKAAALKSQDNLLEKVNSNFFDSEIPAVPTNVSTVAIAAQAWDLVTGYASAAVTAAVSAQSQNSDKEDKQKEPTRRRSNKRLGVGWCEHNPTLRCAAEVLAMLEEAIATIHARQCACAMLQLIDLTSLRKCSSLYALLSAPSWAPALVQLVTCRTPSTCQTNTIQKRYNTQLMELLPSLVALGASEGLVSLCATTFRLAALHPSFQHYAWGRCHAQVYASKALRSISMSDATAVGEPRIELARRLIDGLLNLRYRGDEIGFMALGAVGKSIALRDALEVSFHRSNMALKESAFLIAAHILSSGLYCFKCEMTQKNELDTKRSKRNVNSKTDFYASMSLDNEKKQSSKSSKSNEIHLIANNLLETKKKLPDRDRLWLAFVQRQASERPKPPSAYLQALFELLLVTSSVEVELRSSSFSIDYISAVEKTSEKEKEIVKLKKKEEKENDDWISPATIFFNTGEYHGFLRMIVDDTCNFWIHYNDGLMAEVSIEFKCVKINDPDEDDLFLPPLPQRLPWKRSNSLFGFGRTELLGFGRTHSICPRPGKDCRLFRFHKDADQTWRCVDMGPRKSGSRVDMAAEALEAAEVAAHTSDEMSTSLSTTKYNIPSHHRGWAEVVSDQLENPFGNVASGGGGGDIGHALFSEFFNAMRMRHGDRDSGSVFGEELGSRYGSLELMRTLQGRLAQGLSNSPNWNGAQNSSPSNDGSLTIRVRNADEGGETYFKVLLKTKMVKVFKVYAERSNLDLNKLRFYLNGDRVLDDDTPQSLGLEQLSILECFTEDDDDVDGENVNDESLGGNATTDKRVDDDENENVSEELGEEIPVRLQNDGEKVHEDEKEIVEKQNDDQEESSTAKEEEEGSEEVANDESSSNLNSVEKDEENVNEIPSTEDMEAELELAMALAMSKECKTEATSEVINEEGSNVAVNKEENGSSDEDEDEAAMLAMALAMSEEKTDGPLEQESKVNISENNLSHEGKMNIEEEKEKTDNAEENEEEKEKTDNAEEKMNIEEEKEKTDNAEEKKDNSEKKMDIKEEKASLEEKKSSSTSSSKKNSTATSSSKVKKSKNSQKLKKGKKRMDKMNMNKRKGKGKGKNSNANGKKRKKSKSSKSSTEAKLPKLLNVHKNLRPFIKKLYLPDLQNRLKAAKALSVQMNANGSMSSIRRRTNNDIFPRHLSKGSGVHIVFEQLCKSPRQNQKLAALGMTIVSAALLDRSGSSLAVRLQAIAAGAIPLVIECGGSWANIGLRRAAAELCCALSATGGMAERLLVLKSDNTPTATIEETRNTTEMESSNQIEPYKGLLCNNQHNLVLAPREKNYCDICRKTGTKFRCSQGCDFDVCQRCWDNGKIEHENEQKIVLEERRRRRERASSVGGGVEASRLLTAEIAQGRIQFNTKVSSEVLLKETKSEEAREAKALSLPTPTFDKNEKLKEKKSASFDSDDVEIVMQEAKVCREDAAVALKESNGDVVNAVVSVSKVGVGTMTCETSTSGIDDEQQQGLFLMKHVVMRLASGANFIGDADPVVRNFGARSLVALMSLRRVREVWAATPALCTTVANLSEKPPIIEKKNKTGKENEKEKKSIRAKESEVIRAEENRALIAKLLRLLHRELPSSHSLMTNPNHPFHIALQNVECYPDAVKTMDALHISPASPPLARFNTRRCGRNLGISSDARTVWASGGPGTVLIGKRPLLRGRHYWELDIEQTQRGAGSLFIGVTAGLPQGSLDKFPGGYKWAWISFRATIDARGRERFYGPFMNSGDRIGVLLDCDAGEVFYFCNGRPLGRAFSFPMHLSVTKSRGLWPFIHFRGCNRKRQMMQRSAGLLGGGNDIPDRITLRDVSLSVHPPLAKERCDSTALGLAAAKSLVVGSKSDVVPPKEFIDSAYELWKKWRNCMNLIYKTKQGQEIEVNSSRSVEVDGVTLTPRCRIRIESSSLGMNGDDENETNNIEGLVIGMEGERVILLEDGESGVSLWPLNALRGSRIEVIASASYTKVETSSLLDFARSSKISIMSMKSYKKMNAGEGAGFAYRNECDFRMNTGNNEVDLTSDKLEKLELMENEMDMSEDENEDDRDENDNEEDEAKSIFVPSLCTREEFESRAFGTKWNIQRDVGLLNASIEVGSKIRIGPFGLIPCDVYHASRNVPSFDDYCRRDAGLRWAVLVQLNLLIRGSLDCIRWSSKWGTSSLLNSAKHLIFSAVKLSAFSEGLSRTVCNTPEPEDEYSHPTTIPEVLINRKKAVDVDPSEPLTDQIKSSLFGQLWYALRKKPILRLKQAWSSKENPQRRAFFVKIFGEGVVDQGGPYRTIFTDIVDEVQNRGILGLMEMGRGQFHVFTGRDPLRLQLLTFFGQLVGIAIRCGIQLPLDLPLMFWQKLVGESASIRKIDEPFDELLRAIEVAEDVNELDAIGATFSIRAMDGRHLPLCKGGFTIPVSLENKKLFLQLARKFRLQESELQIDAVMKGLKLIIPSRLLQIFTPIEARDLICGVADVDVNLLAACASYEDGLSKNSREVQFLWKVLRDFSPQQRVKFLEFAWARSRLPNELSSFSHAFIIQALKDDAAQENPDDFLPRSQTCFFTIKLPAYTSVEAAREKILYAVSNCSTMDADLRLQDSEVWT